MAADSGSKYIDWMLSQINDNTYQQAKISEKKNSHFHVLATVTNRGKTFCIQIYPKFNLAPS